MKRYLLLTILFGVSVSGFAQNGKAKRSDGTECATLPCVIATVSLTDQSQAIPVTTIFTPTTDGAFRITVYISTSPGTNKRATWTIYLGWTDLHGAKETPFISAGQNGDSSGNIMVQAVGGQPLLYQVKPMGGGGGVGGMTYDILVAVEQIQ
jgi:hypothetical protein